MFPITDDSATIANCLLAAADAAGVETRLGAIVDGVDRNSVDDVDRNSVDDVDRNSVDDVDRNSVDDVEQEFSRRRRRETEYEGREGALSRAPARRRGRWSAHSLLLATGSMPGGYALAACARAASSRPQIPSLFTFNVADARLADLGGVSFPGAELTLGGPGT